MAESMIGRNEFIARAINWVSLGIGGAIFFSNIHFSGVVMKEIAIQGGVAAGFMPVAGGDDFASMFSRYISAFAVSFGCLLISGIALHPRGLPSILDEVREMEAKAINKGVMIAGCCVVVSLLSYAGFWAYKYDITTTMIAFGVPSIWSVHAFPVWLNVFGPECFFHGTHIYGRLITRGSKKAHALPRPQGLPLTMPAAAPRTQAKPGPWSLKKK
jgi:hypothetical protein